MTTIARFLAVLALAIGALGATTGSAHAADCLSFEPQPVDATPTSGLLGNAIVGQPFSKTITVAGGDDPAYWSVTQALPPGLTWSGGRPGRTITISGTPTVQGHFRVAFSVSASGGYCPGGGRWDIEIGPPKITSIYGDACQDKLIVTGLKLLGFRNSPGELTLAGSPAPYVTSANYFGEDVFEVSPLPPGLPTAGVPFDVKVTTDGGATGSDVKQYTLHGREPAAGTGAATVDADRRVADLHGTVNPGCVSTDYFFEYGKARADGTYEYTDRTVAGRVSGTKDVDVSSKILDLEPGATYHYRVVATNGEGVVRGADATFRLGGGTHIAPAIVTLDARMEKLRGILRARVDDLMRQRLELEPELQRDAAALEKALALETQLEDDLERVQRAAKAVRAAMAALDKADNALPPRVEKLVRERDRLSRELLRLQNLILTAQARGDSKEARSLVPQLESVERRLERAAKAVMDNLPKKRFTPLLSALAQAEKALAKRTDELERDRRHAMNEREQKEIPLRRNLARRMELDRQILDLQEQLSHADLQFRGVRVSVGGATVFHMTATGPFERLDALRKEIFETSNLLAELEQQRKHTKAEFLSLTGDASVAMAKLEVAIRRDSYAKAGVDFLSDVYDVVEAGRKGGLAGALAETASKGVEGLIKAYGPSLGIPAGVDPVSAEGIANAEFNADLKNAFSAPQALKTLGEKSVKQTLGKYAKDTFNQTFGQEVFKVIHGAVPPAWDSLGNTPVQPVSDVGKIISLQEKYKHVLDRKEQYESLKDGFKPGLKAFGANMAKTLVKEVIKSKLKAEIDKDEIAAWRRYFEADAKARLYFPNYQAIARLYWDTYDHLHALMAERSRILASYDPSTGLKIERDEHFAKTATLAIHLDATGAAAGTEPQVWISGRMATQVGPGEFVFDLNQLGTAPDALSLEVR